MGRLFDMEDSFRAYLGQITRYPLLSREDELELALRYWERKDQRAADRLVCCNLRYVVKMANGYRGYGLRVADLVEEGNVGLLEAVRRFDPTRGRRFMTYASFWIRAYILAHVLKQWSMVAVGTGPIQSRLFFRLARERARMSAAFGEGGEVEDHLATRFGTTPERIRAMSGRLEGKDHSLDGKRYADGLATALDQLVDEQAVTEETCARAELGELVRRRVATAAASLSPRERLIIERRLLTDDAATLAEIGRDLGLSRERVRQLEERVKAKLELALRDLADPRLRDVA